jgi:hypothetical protein
MSAICRQHDPRIGGVAGLNNGDMPWETIGCKRSGLKALKLIFRAFFIWTTYKGAHRQAQVDHE